MRKEISSSEFSQKRDLMQNKVNTNNNSTSESILNEEYNKEKIKKDT